MGFPGEQPGMFSLVWHKATNTTCNAQGAVLDRPLYRICLRRWNENSKNGRQRWMKWSQDDPHWPRRLPAIAHIPDGAERLQQRCRNVGTIAQPDDTHMESGIRQQSQWDSCSLLFGIADLYRPSSSWDVINLLQKECALTWQFSARAGYRSKNGNQLGNEKIR